MRGILVSIVAGLAVAGAARAQNTQSTRAATQAANQPLQNNAGKNKTATPLRLCETPTLIADPANNTATSWLAICSDGATAPADLVLDDFVSSTTHLPVGAKPLFFGPTDTTGKPLYSLPALSVGATRLVRLEVSNLWEAGQYEATLRANGNSIGQVRGLKYHLPFAVRLDSPSPDKAEISFERGHAKSVILKSDDDVTYVVQWTLSLQGKSFSGVTELSPKGSASFDVNPPDSWFSWTSLFKDDDRLGQLSLALAPPGPYDSSHWPHKPIQFTAHLGYAAGFGRDAATFAVVFLLLSTGAMVSFFGHVALPNRIKRSQLKEELDGLRARIGGISRLVDSGLRVLLGVERHRWQEVLKSRKASSPDLTGVFAQVQTGIDTLKQQVTLLERIDAAQKDLQRTAQKEVPPTALKTVRESIWRAAEKIDKAEPSPDDLKASASLLDSAENRLEELNRGVETQSPDEKVIPLLDILLKRLDAGGDPFSGIDLGDLGPAGAELHRLHSAMLAAMTPYRSHSTFVACARLDNRTARVQLARDFLEHFRTSTPESRARLVRELPRLVKFLGREDGDGLTHAENVFRQMREDVFPSDLLSAPPPTIDCGPDLQFANDRIKFSLQFENPRFASATACYDLEAHWDFGDGLTETGWETSHYYPAHRWSWRRIGRPAAQETARRRAVAHGAAAKPLDPRNPTVTFIFYSPEPLPAGEKREGAAVPRTLHIQPEFSFLGLKRDRNRIELLRAFLALLPALFGMVAGAKEQLLKTDLVSGILAVLLLGFGSDTIKNLVSKSSQSSAAPASDKAAG